MRIFFSLGGTTGDRSERGCFASRRNVPQRGLGLSFMKEFPLSAVRWEPAFGHPLAKRSRGNAAVGDCLLHQHPRSVRTNRQPLVHEFRDALSHALDEASEIQPDDNRRM